MFAPDKTVLESLREIVTFDKSKVVPPEYVQVLEANIKISFLDNPGVTLNTLDDSDFNIVISNAQKIIVKKKRKAESAAEMLFSGSGGAASILGGLYEKFGADDDDVVNETSLTENQRFQKLTRLARLNGREFLMRLSSLRVVCLGFLGFRVVWRRCRVIRRMFFRSMRIVWRT